MFCFIVGNNSMYKQNIGMVVNFLVRTDGIPEDLTILYLLHLLWHHSPRDEKKSYLSNEHNFN